MKKSVNVVWIALCSMLIMPSLLWAGEIEVLVNKLVEKDILTPVEAQIILDETKQEVANELSQGKSYALPGWVQNIKIKQDLRLRYQNEKRDSDADWQNRGRVRYRLAIESKVAEKLKATFGIATGGDDPRSTNQTFQNFFDSPDVRVDLASLEYTPTSNFKVTGGKFKRDPYLWAPTDMLWDGDIRPEGGSMHYETEISKNMSGFANAGFWVLDDFDQADRGDPFMWYGQLGNKWKEGMFDVTWAATVYKFNDVQGIDPENSKGGNTTDGSGNLIYDYDSVGGSMEFGIKNPFEGLPIERLAFFGDFIYNYQDNVEDDQGWTAGFKFGSKKVSNPKSWQFKYMYTELQKDAWLDTFPDSDRFGGATGVTSHEIALKYALLKNVFLGLDYYKSNRLGLSENEEHLVQLDLETKF